MSALGVAQFVAGMVIAAGAIGSMWFVTRRVGVAVWFGAVETVAALTLIGTIMWDAGEEHAALPVAVAAVCAAAGNWWLCRAAERRRARWLADLTALVELDRDRTASRPPRGEAGEWTTG